MEDRDTGYCIDSDGGADRYGDNELHGAGPNSNIKTKKTLPFGDVFVLGARVELEPLTRYFLKFQNVSNN